LLTLEAKEKFIAFAQQIKISLYPIPTKVPAEIQEFSKRLGFSKAESTLYEIACTHLIALNKCGNPAVASDLLLWVFLGQTLFQDDRFSVYADIDTQIDLEKHQPSVNTDKPLLLPFGEKVNNTDVIILPAPTHDQEKLEQQQLDLLNCIYRQLIMPKDDTRPCLKFWINNTTEIPGLRFIGIFYPSNEGGNRDRIKISGYI
jgi:hypothetical protein